MKTETSFTKLLHFWFYNERSGEKNTIMVIFFSCFICLNLLFGLIFAFQEQIEKLPGNHVSIVFSIIGILCPCAISALFGIWKKRWKPQLNEDGLLSYINFLRENEDGQSENEKSMIRRDSMLNEIQKSISEIERNGRKILFVTGQSGAGKSTLLRQYSTENGENKYHYKGNNYYSQWQDWDADMEKTLQPAISWVIFDQFEQAIQQKTQIEKLKERISSGTQSYILCFRSEYLSEMILAFEDVWNKEDIVFVENSEEDNKRIKDSFFDDMSITEDEYPGMDRKSRFAKKIGERMLAGDVLFIELKLLRCMLLFPEMDDLMEQYLKDSDERHAIRHLCEKIVEYLMSQMEYPYLAEMIVYLCASNKRNRKSYNIADFCNISFESREKIEDTVRVLERLHILSRQSKKVNGTAKYEISHDYIADIVRHYLVGNMDADIINNIDYYASAEALHRTETPIYKKSCESQEDNKFDKANITLYIVMIFFHIILIISQYFNIGIQWPAGEGGYLFLETMAVEIMASLSWFYMYNSYVFYIDLFDRKYGWLKWTGICAIILSILFPTFWAACYGGQIVLFGIIYHFLKDKARESEKNFFTVSCKMYVGIGVAIGGLGSVAWIFYSNFVQMIPVILIFIVYVCISISQHVNRRHVVKLLGKYELPERTF